MSDNSRLEEYLNKVCEKVRWESAHDIIKTDLQNHITDQQEGFIQEGEEKEQALNKAVLEMGSPELTGDLLDKAYRPKTNWWLLIPSILMIIFGMLTQILLNGEINQNYLLALLIGGGAFTAFAFFDYRKLIKPSIIFLCLFLLLAFIGYKISYGKDIFHPSSNYILLLCPILFAASVCKLSKMQIKGYFLSLILFCTTVVLSLYIGSTSSAIIIAASGLLILTVAIAYDMFGISKKLALLILYLPTAFFTFLLMLTKGSSIVWRLRLLINPNSDPMNSGWQMIKTRDFLSSTKFIGSSNGYLKWNELEFDNLVSELFLTKAIVKIGWISFIIVALLLIAILVQGIKASLKQKNNLAMLLSLSIVTTLFIQAASYTTANLGYYFFTEFPIPLFSGNISLVINLILIGILFSIFRYNAVAKADLRQKSKPKSKKLFEISNGSITINYK